MARIKNFHLIIQKLAYFLLLIILSFCVFVYVPIGYTIRLFNYKLSITISTFFTYLFWKINDKIFKLTFTVECKNILKKDKNYFVISNHTSASDFMAVNTIFDKIQTMKNNKYLLKSDLKWIIGFYQLMNLVGSIPVSRNYMQDEKKIKKNITKLTKYKIPANIILYPEGSRLDAKSLKRSHEFSKSRNLQMFDYVLYPRFRGFKLICDCLKDSHIDYVVDLTIVHLNKVPAFWQILFTNFTGKIKIDIEIFNVKEIENYREWLLERFVHKNDLIAKIKNSI